MTINGPGAVSPIPYTPAPRRAERPAAQSAPTRPQAAMPRGADPSLWSVLTSEERAYFAELADLGQLTYGPRPAVRPEPPAPVGQRLDVRV